MPKINNQKISFVTGFWDFGDDIAFDAFIVFLKDLKNYNLTIFIDSNLEPLIWQHRSQDNTKVIHHSKENFGGRFFPFVNKVQEIRTNPQWINSVAWLKDSAQASLEHHNVIAMSKMFLLHNAKLMDNFDSEYFFWIDSDIARTMDLGYLNNENVITNLIKISDHFLFIAFPYSNEKEIHGFDIRGMQKFSNNNEINRVVRGRFFGGHKSFVSEANKLYYSLLNDTLNEGYMGTEENIFTIMTYLDPILYRYDMINSDGLISTFFEKLKQPTYKHKDDKIIHLYINTFNSPEQLNMVLDSFEKHEPMFLHNTKIILINNSTNETLYKTYDNICQQYHMEQICKGNIGICGGRQLCAEHFDASNADYMLFFEDDMLLDYHGVCPFGFYKEVKNLYKNILHIMHKDNYDFLKLSFSEFYGHNGQQWTWHNVPHHQKIEYFGDINHKPFTKFNNIKSLSGIPYADGEVYYSNWPHIISREGNRKCFLETKWDHPYEQTWMSHIYTLTKQNKVKPAILLASPITHNRTHHYHASERREN